MRIIGNKKTAEFLVHLYGISEAVDIVEDRAELHLGRRRLRFLLTPMVHWPETMMTYEPVDGILFSGDAFGGFGALEGGLFDDEVDVHYFEDEILRYFSNIVGKYSPMVGKAIAKLKDVTINIVASTHGPVWRSDPGHIIGLYDRWSRHEAEPGVVIAFASMYGNTETMAEAIARGLSDEGLKSVRIHDVSRSHASYIIRDIWRYKGLILGSPTYDAGVFPLMDLLLKLLGGKRISGRSVGVFGTYGWAGGAAKALKTFVEEGSFELVEPVVEARFAATGDQLERCHELGRRMARQVRGD